MFEAVISIIKKCGDAIVKCNNFLQSFLQSAWSLWMWFLGLMLLMFKTICNFLVTLFDYFADIMNYFTSDVFTNSLSPTGSLTSNLTYQGNDWLGFINTIYPLTETVGFIAIIINLILAFALYKFIKSWIPTLT